MSTWAHTALFICPKGFEANANAVAQAVQHQPGDSDTFGRIWYAQKATLGTQYVSVANTLLTDATLSILIDPSLLPSTPPNGADPTKVQTAIAALKPWAKGGSFDLTADFVYAIDQSPQAVLADLGLVPWVDLNAVTP